MSEALKNPISEGILSLPAEVFFDAALDLGQLSNCQALDQLPEAEQRESVCDLASACLLRLRSASPVPGEDRVPVPATVLATLASGLEVAMRCPRLDVVARWAQAAEAELIQYA